MNPQVLGQGGRIAEALFAHSTTANKCDNDEASRTKIINMKLFYLVTMMAMVVVLVVVVVAMMALTCTVYLHCEFSCEW